LAILFGYVESCNSWIEQGDGTCAAFVNFRSAYDPVLKDYYVIYWRWGKENKVCFIENRTLFATVHI